MSACSCDAPYCPVRFKSISSNHARNKRTHLWLSVKYSWQLRIQYSWVLWTHWSARKSHIQISSLLGLLKFSIPNTVLRWWMDVACIRYAVFAKWFPSITSLSITCFRSFHWSLNVCSKSSDRRHVNMSVMFSKIEVLVDICVLICVRDCVRVSVSCLTELSTCCSYGQIVQ